MKTKKLTLKSNKNGFSVWEGKCWILDASTILKDGSFRFNGEKFKNPAKAKTYKEYYRKS